MKSLKSIIITSLVFFTFTSVQASDTGYEVEMIIFEDVNARYLPSEDWSYNDTLNSAEPAIAEGDDKQKTTKDPEYRQLNWSNAKLIKSIEKLKKNPGFRVLVNKRWKQTGLSRDESFKIPVDSSKEIITEDKNANTKSYITGNVSLIMSRYLHFNIDLDYHLPTITSTSDAFSGTVSEVVTYKKYPVIDERRMRSRETHYIDHPLVGVIVLATPYKLEDEKPAEATTEYKTL